MSPARTGDLVQTVQCVHDRTIEEVAILWSAKAGDWREEKQGQIEVLLQIHESIGWPQGSDVFRRFAASFREAQQYDLAGRA